MLPSLKFLTKPLACSFCKKSTSDILSLSFGLKLDNFSKLPKELNGDISGVVFSGVSSKLLTSAVVFSGVSKSLPNSGVVF